MTESEAIKKLKDILGECTESEVAVCYVTDVDAPALEMAINALKKQIPKKPTPIDYEKYMDTVKNALFLKGAYWCPNCKHVVKCGTYCSDCGQKLEWNK